MKCVVVGSEDGETWSIKFVFKPNVLLVSTITVENLHNFFVPASIGKKKNNLF